MALFRLGAGHPDAGRLDYTGVNSCIDQAQRRPAALLLINLFCGGALLQLSVFALGIMPYITASIISSCCAWSSRGSSS